MAADNGRVCMHNVRLPVTSPDVTDQCAAGVGEWTGNLPSTGSEWLISGDVQIRFRCYANSGRLVTIITATAEIHEEGENWVAADLALPLRFLSSSRTQPVLLVRAAGHTTRW